MNIFVSRRLNFGAATRRHHDQVAVFRPDIIRVRRRPQFITGVFLARRENDDARCGTAFQRQSGLLAQVRANAFEFEKNRLCLGSSGLRVDFEMRAPRQTRFGDRCAGKRDQRGDPMDYRRHASTENDTTHAAGPC